LDIENQIEYVTPYMLAVLKEQYEIAEMLGESGLVDKYYKN
jgi:hypothetical protein